MKQVLVEITCHKCGWSGYHLSQMVIIPQLEPDLRKALLNQDYFKAHCMNCGTQIHFKHECIYQDKEHGFVLWMNKKSDGIHHYEDHIKVRYVHDDREIKEKIKIFEDGLDDKIINQMKKQLQTKGYDELYYHDKQEDLLWFEYHQQYIAIPMKYYKSHK